MLNPYLTPPPRVWPLWLRGVLMIAAVGWLIGILWFVLQGREHDAALGGMGSATFLAEQRVVAAVWSLLVVAYVVAICSALGLDLIARNFKGTVAPVVAFPVHLALGLGAFSVLFFLLGLAPGGFSLWALLLILVAGGINVLRWHRYRPAERGEVFEKPPETFLWYFLVVALMVIALAAALAPPTSHDDLVYHLESPSHMLSQGRVDAAPWNLYAHWPNLLHFIYVPMMALDPSAVAPRVLTVLLGVLIAYCLYRIGGFWFSPRAGGVAGLLFLTSPVVLDAWPVAGLDMAGAFFTTVAMLVLVIAPMERSYAHARLAGVLAGCALACRLTAFSSVAGLLVLVAGRWWRYRRDAEDTIGFNCPRLPRLLIAFLWPIVLVMLPFIIRMWVETGNPVYPFLFSIFGGAGWSRELTEGVARWQTGAGMGHGFGDFIRLPWRLVVHGGATYERFAGVLQPWYLILFPLAFGWPQHLRKVTLLCLMMLVTTFLWFRSSQQVRFLMPMLPWAALVGGLGFDSVVRGFPKVSRAWVSGGLGLLMAITGIFLLAPRDVIRFSENVQVALTHGDSRKGYLRRNLAIYPAIEWLNGRPPTEVTGVLMLFDNRGYHLDPVNWAADPIFEVPRTFLHWRGLDSVAILEELSGQETEEQHPFLPPNVRISHILVNTAWREQVLGYHLASINAPMHDEIWERILPHLDEVHADERGFVIYEVDYSALER